MTTDLLTTDLLTVPEAASLLRLSECSVYRRLESGDWNDFAWKAGKSWRIEREPLLAHLRKKPIHPRPNEDPMPKAHDRRARFEAVMTEHGRAA